MDITSARVIFHQELIQGHPTTTHPHHHRTAQDPHQPQLLRISKLNTNREHSHSSQIQSCLPGTGTQQSNIRNLGPVTHFSRESKFAIKHVVEAVSQIRTLLVPVRCYFCSVYLWLPLVALLSHLIKTHFDWDTTLVSFQKTWNEWSIQLVSFVALC